MTQLAETITDVVADVAAHGDRPAIRSQRDGAWVDVSYRRLDEEVRQLASGLIAAGVGLGDRVCILSETRPEWTLVDFASRRAS